MWTDALTRLVGVKQVLLRGQDLRILLRRLQALRVQQDLDAQLPARPARRVRGAAGADFRPWGGKKKQRLQPTSM